MAKRFGLALSGGGFRATLFHVGVISCLRDRGLLPEIGLVTSVSGGSILAAHLALKWSNYTGTEEQFADASSELLSIVRSGLRGAVVRRWLLGTLLVLPRILRRLTFHSLMVKQLQKLYKGASINCLAPSDGPRFEILATSITSGNLCKFTDTAFVERFDWTNEKGVRTSQLPVAIAVAASAAFPPLFPPVPIDRELLKVDAREFDRRIYLTDGGVFDNLGLEELYRVSASESTLGITSLIVSDAGGNFDWAPDRAFSFVVNRNIRATNILMDRVSKLVPSDLIDRAQSIAHIFIGKELAQSQETSAQSPETQWLVRNTRTDLDAFSEKEIAAIIRHGFAQTSWSLREKGLSRSADSPRWEFIKESAHDFVKHDEKPRGRSLGLFSWSDPISYVLLILLLLPTFLLSSVIRNKIGSAYSRFVQAHRMRTVEVTIEDPRCSDLSGAILHVSTARPIFFDSRGATDFVDIAPPGTYLRQDFHVELPTYGKAQFSVTGQKVDWNAGTGSIVWTTTPVEVDLAQPERKYGQIGTSWIVVDPEDGGDFEIRVYHSDEAKACPSK